MYQCALCQDKIENDLLVYHGHVEQHIVEIIKRDHPEWSEKDGMCQKCLEYLRAQLKGTPFQDDSKTCKGRAFLAGIKKFFGKS